MATPTGTRAFHLSVGDANAVHVYSNAERIWLQLRRSVPTHENIGDPSFKVAVSLTVKQAVALAGELLSVSAGRLNDPTPAAIATGKRLPFFPVPNPVADEKVPDASKPKPAKQGKLWSAEEEERLTELFDSGANIPQIAGALARGVGGVQARLIKLGRMNPEQYATFAPAAEQVSPGENPLPDADGRR